MKTLGEEENYKYRGIIQWETIKQVKIKEKVSQEYYRIIRKQQETKKNKKK